MVTETDYSRDWLRRRCPAWAHKIERTYNGIYPGEFARADFSAQPPEIVSVGRLIEKKGFNDLIDACGLLRQRGADFRCRIIGAGPLENALREQIARAGLDPIVTLEGARQEAEVIAYLRRARVFALACARDPDGGSDNLPTVIMEAMAAGLPIVSTRVAGIPEMIEEGVTGRILAEHDVTGIAVRAGHPARRCGAGPALRRRRTRDGRAKIRHRAHHQRAQAPPDAACPRLAGRWCHAQGPPLDRRYPCAALIDQRQALENRLAHSHETPAGIANLPIGISPTPERYLYCSGSATWAIRGTLAVLPTRD